MCNVHVHASALGGSVCVYLLCSNRLTQRTIVDTHAYESLANFIWFRNVTGTETAVQPLHGITIIIIIFLHIAFVHPEPV